MTLPCVYFVGAHGTGKSSRTRWVSRRYGIPMIQEVARSELELLGARLDDLRRDTAAVSAYQRRVWRRQLDTEAATPRPHVSDRSADNLAYLALNGEGVAAIVGSDEFREAIDRLKSGIVFIVRPHAGAPPADGVRAAADTTRDGQMRVDGAVDLLLEVNGVVAVPLPAAPVRDQERIVSAVLEARGFVPAGDPSVVPAQRFP